MEIFSLKELLNYYSSNKRIKYLFFWSHKERGDEISKACLSQWYEAPFEFEGRLYLTAEHFMMAKKAKLFSDMESFEKILQAKHHGEAKKFGRGVKNFNQKLWEQKRFDIVVQGNLLKFSQNQKLKNFLLAASNRVLVEASPKDTIWGIGLDEKNKDAQIPYKWRGLNLLGFALMKVRTQLQNEIY